MNERERLDPIEATLVMLVVIFLAIGVPMILVIREWWANPKAYCVKERAKKKMISAYVVVLRNGRKVLKGECGCCGTTLFRIK